MRGTGCRESIVPESTEKGKTSELERHQEPNSTSDNERLHHDRDQQAPPTWSRLTLAVYAVAYGRKRGLLHRLSIFRTNIRDGESVISLVDESICLA